MKKFKARIYGSTGNLELKEVEGYAITLPFDIPAFVSRSVENNTQWAVTEPTTGLKIGHLHSTKKEAIAEAVEAFNKIGKEKVIEAIARQNDYYAQVA